MTESQWFYADEHRQPAGPLAESRIRALLAAGTITGRTLLWRDGLSDWEEADKALRPESSPVQPPPSVFAQITADRQRHAALRARRRNQSTALSRVFLALAILAGAALLLQAARVRSRTLSRAPGSPPAEGATVRSTAPDLKFDPARMTLEEKMAVADRHLAWLETEIPSLVTRLRKSQSAGTEDFDANFNELNAALNKSPFTRLQFPCVDAIRARGEAGAYASYIAWFEHYSQREKAVMDRVLELE